MLEKHKQLIFHRIKGVTFITVGLHIMENNFS